MKGVRPFPTAYVPIIKVTAAGSETDDVKRPIKLDITFQSPSHRQVPLVSLLYQHAVCVDLICCLPSWLLCSRGHRTTSLAVSLLTALPPLAPLVLVLKQVSVFEVCGVCV